MWEVDADAVRRAHWRTALQLAVGRVQRPQRFGLLKGKRWFYRQSQVDLGGLDGRHHPHVLSLERCLRMNTPPVLAAPA